METGRWVLGPLLGPRPKPSLQLLTAQRPLAPLWVPACLRAIIRMVWWCCKVWLMTVLRRAVDVLRCGGMTGVLLQATHAHVRALRFFKAILTRRWTTQHCAKHLAAVVGAHPRGRVTRVPCP